MFTPLKMDSSFPTSPAHFSANCKQFTLELCKAVTCYLDATVSTSAKLFKCNVGTFDVDVLPHRNDAHTITL